MKDFSTIFVAIFSFDTLLAEAKIILLINFSTHNFWLPGSFNVNFIWENWEFLSNNFEMHCNSNFIFTSFLNDGQNTKYFQHSDIITQVSLHWGRNPQWLFLSEESQLSYFHLCNILYFVHLTECCW